MEGRWQWGEGGSWAEDRGQGSGVRERPSVTYRLIRGSGFQRGDAETQRAALGRISEFDLPQRTQRAQRRGGGGSSRVMGSKVIAAVVSARFPLTLSLSLGERGGVVGAMGGLSVVGFDAVLRRLGTGILTRRRGGRRGRGAGRNTGPGRCHCVRRTRAVWCCRTVPDRSAGAPVGTRGGACGPRSLGSASLPRRLRRED